MIKYNLGIYGQLTIAKSTKIEHGKVSTYVHYSDHSHIPVGLEDTKLPIWDWESLWLKLDTEGKKNIIKKKFEVLKYKE